LRHLEILPTVTEHARDFVPTTTQTPITPNPLARATLPGPCSQARSAPGAACLPVDPIYCLQYNAVHSTVHTADTTFRSAGARDDTSANRDAGAWRFAVHAPAGDQSGAFLRPCSKHTRLSTEGGGPKLVENAVAAERSAHLDARFDASKRANPGSLEARRDRRLEHLAARPFVGRNHIHLSCSVMSLGSTVVGTGLLSQTAVLTF